MPTRPRTPAFALAAALLASSCGSGGAPATPGNPGNRGDPTTPSNPDDGGRDGNAVAGGLHTFQAASLVIGQPTFTTGGNSGRGNPPTATTLDGAQGDPELAGTILYVPDRSNSRVLGYLTMPTANGAAADFVLGEPDFYTRLSTTELLAGGVDARRMAFPSSVTSAGGKLFVLDALWSRILVWNTLPTVTNTPADLAIGAPDLVSIGTRATCTGMSSPAAMRVAAGKLIVADTLNDRVLVWNTVPTRSDVPADLFLGTPDAPCGDDPTGAASVEVGVRLDRPRGVWSDGTRLVVADSEHHRVLVWNTFPTRNAQPADVVLGQRNLTNDYRNASGQPGAADLSTPWGVESDGTALFVADHDNNRVLIWDAFPTAHFAPATAVLGQSAFELVAANDGDQDGSHGPRSARTLEWPTALKLAGSRLMVTDGGGERILVFDRH